MARAKANVPPIIVLAGDDEYHKSRALDEIRDRLLPPPADRSMALCDYDGTKPDDQGGLSLAAVLDDLCTLPFLADRRVVIIRDADRFVTAQREKLEKYLAGPSPTGTLVLVCRSFPKTTRLYKAAVAGAGQIIECKKLTGRGLIEFAQEEARRLGKRLDYPIAARLAELIGNESGILAGEIEKLSLYVGERPAISERDVTELVGQTREERIFAVMDAAAAGRPAEALELWSQTLATDRAAEFKAVGGIAFVLRRWLAAHEMRAAGQPIAAIAPKVMMWGRERELDALLRRLSPARIKRLLASLGELDAEAKIGARSIEMGVEALLVEAAAPAA